MKAEDHNLQKELSTLIGRRPLTARLPWLSILWLLAKFTCRTWVSCWGTCSATSHRVPRSCHNRMAERGKYRSSEALQPSQPAAPSASRTTCHSFSKFTDWVGNGVGGPNQVVRKSAAASAGVWMDSWTAVQWSKIFWAPAMRSAAWPFRVEENDAWRKGPKVLRMNWKPGRTSATLARKKVNSIK